MRNRKTFVGLFVILALLCLGIGYATVSKTLTIEGSATGLVDDKFFNVIFTEDDPYYEGSLGQSITATLDGSSATLAVPKLTDPNGFGAQTHLKIQNLSTHLGAKLAKVKITVDGEEQEYDLSDPELYQGDRYRCRYKTEFFIIVVSFENLSLDFYGDTAAINDQLINSTWVGVKVGFNKIPVEEQTIDFTIEIIAEAVPVDRNVSVPKN